MTEFRLAGSGEALLTDAKRRERVLRYLRSGARVGAGHRTDGRWIWPSAVEERVEADMLAPEPELLDHIVRYGFRCPPVTTATVGEATTALAALLR